MYIGASGIFSDVWAAWTELIVNIGVTLCLAPFYGIIGILLGKIISMLFLIVIWKPFFLFKRGFKESITIYWSGVFKHYFILLFSLAICYAFCHISNRDISPTFTSIMFTGVSITLPTIVIYSALLYLFAPGIKDLICRIPLFKKS